MRPIVLWAGLDLSFPSLDFSGLLGTEESEEAKSSPSISIYNLLSSIYFIYFIQKYDCELVT